MKQQVKHYQMIYRQVLTLVGVISLMIGGRICSLWLHKGAVGFELSPTSLSDCLKLWAVWVIGLSVSMSPWEIARLVAALTLCPGYNEKYLKTDTLKTGKELLLGIIIVFFLFIFKWTDRRFQFGLVAFFLWLCVNVIEAYALLLIDFVGALGRAMKSYRSALLTEADAVTEEDSGFGTIGSTANIQDSTIQ